MARNGRRLLVLFLAMFVAIVGTGMLLGCGVVWPPPIQVWRSVDFHEPVEFEEPISGDTVIDGDLEVRGTIAVTGDGNFGGTVTADEIPPPSPPPVPPLPPPPLLTATLRSDNGNDHFKVGDDVKLTVYASGGEAPYSFRCLWVDGDFSIKEISPDPKFALKVIDSPGAGQVVCRVKSADSQQTDASLTIYVDP